MLTKEQQEGHDSPRIAQWAFWIVWYSIQEQGFDSQPHGFFNLVT